MEFSENSNLTPTKFFDINKAYAFFILFGFLGAHRFYLKKYFSGALQLLFAIFSLGGLAFFFIKFDMFDEKAMELVFENSTTLLFILIFSYILFFVLAIWLLIDFFRLKKMTADANLSSNLQSYEPVPSKFDTLKNIKILRYISLILMIIFVIFSMSSITPMSLFIYALSMILYISSSVSIAKISKSKNLLFNYATCYIALIIGAIIFGMNDAYENVVFYVLGIPLLLISLVYTYLYYKELADLSHQRTFLLIIVCFAFMILLEPFLLKNKFVEQLYMWGCTVLALIEIFAWSKTQNLQISSEEYTLKSLFKKK